jgi:UDP-3-O-acyl-N-acetylglucosamine deacetylase
LTPFELAAQPESLRRGLIFTFGGLIGEILITMTAILDFIHSNPLHTSFRFTSDQIENFLAALIDKEIGNFRIIVTENS